MEDHHTSSQRPSSRLDSNSRLRLTIVVVVLIAVAILVAIAEKAVQTKVTSHDSYTRVATVDIDVGSGKVHLLPSKSDAVTVDRHLTYVFSKPSITQRMDGNRLMIRQRCDGLRTGPCNATYDIAVPNATNVRAKNAKGDFNIESVAASIDASAEHGSIEVQNAYGMLSLASKSGSIDATRLQSLDVRASSGSGDVTLEFAGAPTSIDAVTSNGDVDVKVPAKAGAYNVSADAANGKTTIDVRTDPNVARKIHAHSDNGDVTVEGA